MTTTAHEIKKREAGLRAELLSALMREGIPYRLDRLDEAAVEYGQLKRLMAVVAAATGRTGPR